MLPLSLAEPRSAYEVNALPGSVIPPRRRDGSMQSVCQHGAKPDGAMGTRGTMKAHAFRFRFRTCVSTESPNVTPSAAATTAHFALRMK